MSLPGDLVARLEAALLDAFPDGDSFDRLIRRLGLQGHVPERAVLLTRLDKLVQVADAQGRILDLLDAASELCAGNVMLARARPAVLRHFERTRTPPTSAAAHHPTAPRPAYASAEVEALSNQLEGARRRKQALSDAGLAIDDVDREILQLRRQLREGGQLRAGDTLGDGRYLLVKQLGRGGFALVWEAWDRLEAQRVAIKVLHANLAGDPLRCERFFRGAQAMRRLAHPAVVQVLEPRGEDGGFYYFVMELVQSGNLREAVLEKRLQGDDALRPVLQVGEALAVAHARGMIHRDIKPANILLDDQGNGKLTDFDLVGAHDTTGGTRTGALGTIVYAAPECLDKPQNATPRADVFSLGMTAIFCLSGQDLSMDTLVDRAGALSQLDCTIFVRKVLERAVEWKPDRRFADAAEMVIELGKALETADQPAAGEQQLIESRIAQVDEHHGAQSRVTIATSSDAEARTLQVSQTELHAHSSNSLLLFGSLPATRPQRSPALMESRPVSPGPASVDPVRTGSALEGRVPLRTEIVNGSKERPADVQPPSPVVTATSATATKTDEACREDGASNTGLQRSVGIENDPDSDIVRLLDRGDHTAALTVMMKRHGMAVYRYCHYALHDRTLAEDVHQQIFIQAHRDLQRLDREQAVRTWLFTIARRRVLDAAKSRRHAQAQLDEGNMADTPDPAPPTGERLDEARLQQAMIDCLRGLPENVRAALILRYQQGFTFEDLSAILHERPATIQARVMRALPLLRACIERRTGGRLWRAEHASGTGPQRLLDDSERGGDDR
jgi:RNA polymerase sigma factor (sigma-70 family)